MASEPYKEHVTNDDPDFGLTIDSDFGSAFGSTQQIIPEEGILLRPSLNITEGSLDIFASRFGILPLPRRRWFTGKKKSSRSKIALSPINQRACSRLAPPRPGKQTTNLQVRRPRQIFARSAVQTGTQTPSIATSRAVGRETEPQRSVVRTRRPPRCSRRAPRPYCLKEIDF
ncbi:hypothetical protein EVAR_19697_1 [Eumeta japonica]|uniref:Uncharacterized protein n=1 Tax=Eumeta variegata TaxID=151549 RepID=A0A4C1V3P1_EUMVA|nr:hypothetical protein EVAR_19697_1 [Eumeta japonica]